MTFSDSRVIDALNRDFVCAWTNTRPDISPSSFPVIDPRTLQNWQGGFAQGTGANNVGLLYCTSDGWVLHEMRGFFAPEAFLEELRFVVSARDELTRGGAQVRFDDASRGMRERHQLQIASLQGRTGWEGRRRPSPQDSEFALRVRFHQVGLSQPLRRVENVRPEIEQVAHTRG